MPGSLKVLRPEIKATATSLVRQMAGEAQFNGIYFAGYLPLTLVRDFVGLPEGGQAYQLEWASAAFDFLGPQNERGQKASPQTILGMAQWSSTRVPRQHP